jgi:ankyrin repeat protein
MMVLELRQALSNPAEFNLQNGIQKSRVRRLRQIAKKDREKAVLLQFAQKLQTGLNQVAAFRDELIDFLSDCEEENDIYEVKDLLRRQPASLQEQMASLSLPYLTTLAEEFQCWDLVEEFLQSGASLDATDEMGLTALMSATDDAPAEKLELLIRYGADVNARDESGDSVLTRSMMRCPERTDVHQLLRSHGAKTSEELDAEAKKKGR